jgi:hypothetical protein
LQSLRELVSLGRCLVNCAGAHFCSGPLGFLKTRLSLSEPEVRSLGLSVLAVLLKAGSQHALGTPSVVGLRLLHRTHARAWPSLGLGFASVFRRLHPVVVRWLRLPLHVLVRYYTELLVGCRIGILVRVLVCVLRGAL